MTFVPAGFAIPDPPSTDLYRLEPLGPEHNERDHAAWTSSIPHIRATPGFDQWPPDEGMSLEANLADLVRHAADFENRTGFTYTVLEGDDVIGCVYIYPSREDPAITTARTWVRADRAHLDAHLARTVFAWLTVDWPFETIACR